MRTFVVVLSMLASVVGHAENFTATGSTVTASDTYCGGGTDPSAVARCGFDAFRAHVREQGSTEKCAAEIKNFVCHQSPWSSLPLQSRIHRITLLAARQARVSGIDYRAMPCLTRRESIWYDPMIMTPLSCSTPTTDQGLGQVTFSTFEDMFTRGFRSKLPVFSQPPYSTDARTLFSAMSLSAELQMEVVQAVFAEKLAHASGNYENAFASYNGGADRVKYGQQVNACYQCLSQPDANGKSRLSPGAPTADELASNIDDCIDKSMDGKGVEFSFAKFATECHGETFDRWSYWLSLGKDPVKDGSLDPITHQPVDTPKPTALPPK